MAAKTSKFALGICGIVALWALFGQPSQTIANWFWPYKPAPWESVTAAYYPNYDEEPEREELLPGLSTIEECQAWASGKASARPKSETSNWSYLCWIGTPRMFGSLKVYRTNAK